MAPSRDTPFFSASPSDPSAGPPPVGAGGPSAPAPAAGRDGDAASGSAAPTAAGRRRRPRGGQAGTAGASDARGNPAGDKATRAGAQATGAVAKGGGGSAPAKGRPAKGSGGPAPAKGGPAKRSGGPARAQGGPAKAKSGPAKAKSGPAKAKRGGAAGATGGSARDRSGAPGPPRSRPDRVLPVAAADTAGPATTGRAPDAPEPEHSDDPLVAARTAATAAPPAAEAPPMTAPAPAPGPLVAAAAAGAPVTEPDRPGRPDGPASEGPGDLESGATVGPPPSGPDRVPADRTETRAPTTDAAPTGAASPIAPAPAPLRLVIEDVAPTVAGGRFPVKRVVGEPVTVHATVYAEGHDHLWCVVAHLPPHRDPDDVAAWEVVPLVAENAGLDLWRGEFTPEHEGVHRFRVLAWIDDYGSWAAGTTRKLEAGVPVDSERLEGAAILERAAARHEAAGDGPAAEDLRGAAAQLRSGDLTPLTDRGSENRLAPAALVHRSFALAAAASSDTVDVLVERERALFSSWYELFPRSWGAGPGEHGTFADVQRQLGYVADMGFDVLYLPPVHPIGVSFRKGRNNAEQAEPDDHGSPWAIGGPEGGHTAIHPALGTLEDLRNLIVVAGENGIEVALDIAFQCSPDHPWVREHPEWFRHRPDGSIQYAENPPKKYQDIYPLHFDQPDWESLWHALRAVFFHWMDQGVRIFRVDNPHTKPFPFWEWVIGELRRRDPGVILLSEAFTRPRVMHRLTQAGFTLSYSYFPWRVSKDELTEYFTELSTPPSVDEFRPSAWPNTPDILPRHLMGAGLSTFAVRAFAAATLCPSWGIYGPAFELGDNTPANNGKEEYLDSEKYEIKRWDRDDPRSLRPLISRLNRIRTENQALHTLRTLRFHEIPNGALLCFSKTPHAGPSVDPATPYAGTVLVVANLDPDNVQAGHTALDLSALGVDANRPFDVHDLVSGEAFTWHGPHNYVELHPARQPGHIFRVTQG